MSRPIIVAVEPGSPAYESGLLPGDEIVTIDGEVPTDVIRWQLLVDEPDPVFEISRGGLEISVIVAKSASSPLGADVDAAIFDRVRTCDNHCEFCFIYQLPKGMRRSLYMKDDDYRLSFLYGNFTTLTRFTEADLERVISEGLSPLYVSIHATDPEVRSRMLKNKRGAYSLRWLRALLDHGIEIHGQIVVCPGLNDGDLLDQSLMGILDKYPELASVAVVPLGVSDYNRESSMRAHSEDEARKVVEIVEDWQSRFFKLLGRRMVFAADEYYLLANVPFPSSSTYGDFPMHEDGIGMVRAFEAEFNGAVESGIGPRAGFFHWVDGAPAEGYRAPREKPVVANRGGELLSDFEDLKGSSVSVQLTPRKKAPIGILTGSYGMRVLAPLLEELDREDVRLIEVENKFFGGNIGVSGLMVGADISRVLEVEPEGHRYLLPDVCLSSGRFLDGIEVVDLPRSVEVVPADGISLRAVLERTSQRSIPGENHG